MPRVRPPLLIAPAPLRNNIVAVFVTSLFEAGLFAGVFLVPSQSFVVIFPFEGSGLTQADQ